MLSALLLASLAWLGHAVGEEGRDHLIHLAADVVHLLAAGAWLGGLPMLALLFHRALAGAIVEAQVVVQEATRRFSVMGLFAVGALLATGVVNTWYLAGSLPALLGTDYGRWLLVKIGLFAAMVATAAVNRQVLTPRLAFEPGDRVGGKARGRRYSRFAATAWSRPRSASASLPSSRGSAVRCPAPISRRGGPLRFVTTVRPSPCRNIVSVCGTRLPQSWLRLASPPADLCFGAGGSG